MYRLTQKTLAELPEVCSAGLVVTAEDENRSFWRRFRLLLTVFLVSTSNSASSRVEARKTPCSLLASRARSAHAASTSSIRLAGASLPLVLVDEGNDCLPLWLPGLLVRRVGVRGWLNAERKVSRISLFGRPQARAIRVRTWLVV